MSATFDAIDRNHDGIVSASELDTYRKMKGSSQSHGVASSLAANLPSIDEGLLNGSARQYATGASPLDAPPPDELLPPAGPTPLPDGSTLDLAPVGSYNLAFGLPVRDTAESVPIRRHHADKAELLESLVAESSAASIVLRLDPGVPYVVSVHTARPGELANYSLHAYSDALISFTQIEATTQRVLRASWRSATAGGCHIESAKWMSNPQFGLRVGALTNVEITLGRPANKWKGSAKARTLESMMGFYVLRGETVGQRVRPEQAEAAVIHQTVFLPAHEVKASLYLEPLPDDAPYIIMPATFGAGQRGPFSLGINTDVPCEFEPLPDAPGTGSPYREPHSP